MTVAHGVRANHKVLLSSGGPTDPHQPTHQGGDRFEPTRGNAGPAVLGLIRRNDGVSRTELARRMGLSAQAISKTVARLVDEGLVWESGRQSVGVGKARTRLSIIPQSRFAFGVHLDRSAALVSLVDLAGTVIASRTFEYASVPSPEETIEIIASAVAALSSAHPATSGRVVGCGIGMAGPIDHRLGVATAPNNFAGWRDVPLASMLSEQLGTPVLLDKQTNMVMFTDQWQAPRQGWALLVYVGTGIGAAWMIGGEIYRGADSDAGEFGHMVVDPTGPHCVCGRRGCLEVYTSPAAIVQRFGSAGSLPDGPAAWGADTEVRLEEIARLARAGDTRARSALYDSGLALGISVANLVTLLDIADVTLAGPMIGAVGPHYLRGVEDGFVQIEAHPTRPAQISVSPDVQFDRIAAGAAYLVLGDVGS